jgi:hypothetical protein
VKNLWKDKSFINTTTSMVSEYQYLREGYQWWREAKSMAEASRING